MARDHRARLTAAEGRKFGLTVGAAFLAIGGILAWRGRGPASIITLSLGGLLVASSLLVPTRLGPVQRAWMGLAHAISRVTTPVFMSIVYYLVLMPTGLVRRAVAQNPLRRTQSETTYWIDHDPSASGGMERQF